MNWAKEETLTTQEIEEIQFTRLKKTLKRIYEKVRHIRRKWMKRELHAMILNRLMICLNFRLLKQDLGYLSL